MAALSATPEQIEWLLRAGHSDLSVHRMTGVTRKTVARYRKRLGLPGYLVTADDPSCRYGHPFPENRAFYANGRMYCVACDRARGRRAVGHRSVEPDEVAIERAVSGDAPERLTPGERAAAVRRLDRRGLSAAEIAERVRCSRRNVYYLRSAFRRAA